MKRLLTLLSLFICASAIAQTAGRVWLGGSIPATKPTSFGTGDVWRDTVAKISYRYKSGWYIPTDQLSGAKGDKGDTGATGAKGADGVCPPCPTTTAPSGSIGSIGTIRYVGSWAEYVQAWADVEAGKVYEIDIYQNLVATSKVKLPTTVSRTIIIDGHGNSIIDNTGFDTLHVRSYPSISAAAPYMDAQLDFKNIIFYGKQEGIGVCFYPSSTYGSSWDNCKFARFKYALYLPFDLMASVTNNRFDASYVDIYAGLDMYSGGGNGLSQSNHIYIANNCFRSNPGARANIECVGVSGILVLHNIFEGGDESQGGLGADYAFYFNENWSNNVKESTCMYNHLEFKPKIAGFYYRVHSSVNTLAWVYFQKDNTNLVTVENYSTGYPSINVTGIPYFPTGSTMQEIGNGVRWNFSYIKPEWIITNTANWVGGKLPSVYSNIGIDANGQLPTINLNGRKL